MANKTQSQKNVSIQIGNKVLTLDNADEMDADFLARFNEVAAAKPKSIQEFFEKLAQDPVAKKKIARKRSVPDGSVTKAKKTR